VYLNSEGFAINNVEASIQYPRDLIDVMSISKSGSVFSLWVEEPSFSNASGLINLNGGSPSPGFTGSQGLVVTFLVKAKKAGTANITFSSAAARADDGLGTDVLNTQIVKTLTIGAATPTPVPTPKPTTETPAPAPTKAPNTLQITSSSHPNQDSWFKDNTMIFKWNVPAGVTSVQTTVDTTNSNTPHVTYTPPISTKTVENAKDGVWYFKVRARAGGVWGPISSYIARIDSVDPELKNVSFNYDNTSKILTINAAANDATSGLDHYDVIINDILVKNIPAN